MDFENNNKKVITEEDILLLREKIRPYLKEKRYLHTLSVERESASLSEIFFPHDKQTEMRLRVSALLHDITKALSLEKQLQYCEEFGIIVRKDDFLSPKVFHAKTASALAARDFADFTDEEILSGIRWHTTGRYGMSLFESIIYLADYIEPERTFDDCVRLREYFYSSLNGTAFSEDVLVDTMILSFDMTISALMKEGALIDSDTIEARNYFVIKKLKKDMGICTEVQK